MARFLAKQLGHFRLHKTVLLYQIFPNKLHLFTEIYHNNEKHLGNFAEIKVGLSQIDCCLIYARIVTVIIIQVLKIISKAFALSTPD